MSGLTNLSSVEQSNLMVVLEKLKRHYGFNLKIEPDVPDTDGPYSVKVTDSDGPNTMKIVEAFGRSGLRQYHCSTLKSILVQQGEPCIRDIILTTSDRMRANSDVILDIQFTRDGVGLRKITNSDIQTASSVDKFDEIARNSKNQLHLKIEKEIYTSMCQVSAFINRAVSCEYQTSIEIDNHHVSMQFDGIDTFNLSYMEYLMSIHDKLVDVTFKPQGADPKSRFKSTLVFKFASETKKRGR